MPVRLAPVEDFEPKVVKTRCCLCFGVTNVDETARQVVAHKEGGQTLRVEGLEGDGVVVQQAAEEAVSRPVHSSSLLLVNRSYISTMNLLALRERGPSGFFMTAVPGHTCAVTPLEGMSKTEVIRCLKRYVARQVFSALQSSMEKVG